MFSYLELESNILYQTVDYVTQANILHQQYTPTSLMSKTFIGWHDIVL